MCADYDPFFPVFSPERTGTSRNAGIQKLSQNSDNWSLYDAVTQRRLDVVERILSTPASFDFQEIAGALRLCGQRGYADIGRFLISRTGVQVDTHCPDGYTALILAARQGHDEMVRMLIENGADPSRAIYRTRVSALHWASGNGHAKCVDALLKAGALPNPMTLQHRTPLLLAACYGHLDVIKLLIRALKEEEIIHADSNGMTALHMSVMQGYSVCADFLLSHAANIDAQNNQGYTPLLMAIEHDFPEIAFRLIRADADLELSLYGCQCRAIHIAIALERNDICRYLIEGGCSVTATCEIVQTCCGSVILHGNINPLHIAASGKEIATLNKIFEKLEEKDEITSTLMYSSISDGHSPLMLGAIYGSAGLLSELVKRYKKFAVSDERKFLDEISLAVTCAALRGRPTTLTALLQKTGAILPKPRIQLNNGNTRYDLKTTRITPEIINEICPEGRLSEDILRILIAAGNCDEILRAFVDLLPDDTMTAEFVANRFAYPARLEQLCVGTIRRVLGPLFDTERVSNELNLPPILLKLIMFLEDYN